MNVLPRLEALRDALATIPDIATCKIGLEADITPADYPMIRLVPASIRQSQSIGRRRAEVLIYFGMPIQAFDEEPDSSGRVRLEKLYAALFALEGEIRTVIDAQNCLYRETITDEDRLDTYKMMAARIEMEA